MQQPNDTQLGPPTMGDHEDEQRRKTAYPATCPQCQGTGGGVYNDCPTCDGNGVV